MGRGIWLAVEYPDHGWYGEDTVYRALFEVRENNRCHWMGSVTYCSWPQGAKVLHAYGFEPTDADGDTWADDVIAHYRQTFGRFEPHDINRAISKDVDGFLAPTGELYRCGWSEHTSAARRLCEQFKIETAEGLGDIWETALLEHGWITIGHGRITSKYQPTESQIQFLTKLRQLNDSFALYCEAIDRFMGYVQRGRYTARPE